MRCIRFLICKIFLLILCLSVLQTASGQHTEEIHKAVTVVDLNKVQTLFEADSMLLEPKDDLGEYHL